MNKYVIYTKNNCKYCENVKILLKDVKPEPQIILCDNYLTDDKTKNDFLKEMSCKIGQEYRTFPMVFFNNRFIGGYEKTLRFYERSCMIDTEDTDF